jgi:hypothetical protein
MIFDYGFSIFESGPKQSRPGIKNRESKTENQAFRPSTSVLRKATMAGTASTISSRQDS